MCIELKSTYLLTMFPQLRLNPFETARTQSESLNWRADVFTPVRIVGANECLRGAVDARSSASRTAMDEFGGNASESREGRRDKARWRRCVRACVSARPPPPPIHLYGFIAASIALWPATRSLARALFLFYFSLAGLPVPFFYRLSCPLVFLSLYSFYDSGPIPWLAIGFTLVYCVLTLFAYAIAVYFVLFRWSFQILNFGFDSSPGPHILLVINLAIPSPTSRRLLNRR